MGTFQAAQSPCCQRIYQNEKADKSYKHDSETNNIINSFDIPQVSRVPLHMPSSSEQQSIEQPMQYHRIDESDIQFNRENVIGLFSNDNAIKEDEKLKEQYERLQNMVLNSSANNNAVNSAFTNMTNNMAIESTEKSAFMNVKRPIPIRQKSEFA